MNFEARQVVKFYNSSFYIFYQISIIFLDFSALLNVPKLSLFRYLQNIFFITINPYSLQINSRTCGEENPDHFLHTLYHWNSQVKQKERQNVP